MAVPNRWGVLPDAETIARNRSSGVWNGRTIVQDLREIVAKTPNQVLWVEGAHELTAQQALDQGEAFASHLHALGLREGDVVSFQLPNWTESVVVDVACVLLGLVINPVVPIYRDAELAMILNDCQAKALIIPAEFRSVQHAEMIERLWPKLPHLKHVIVARGDPSTTMHRFEDMMTPTGDPVPWPEQKPEAVKLIMYTSGTTGRPKGVLHSHETMARSLYNCFTHWSLKPGDWCLMPSPVTHVTGFGNGIEMPLVMGTRTVFMERWNADEAVALIDRYGVRYTVGATPFLAELVTAAQKAGSQCRSLSTFACGGAAVPPALIRRANTTFSQACAFRVYGSTESPVVTLGFRGPDTAEVSADTDGEIVGYEVRFVDEAGDDVPEGAEGEILVRGPSLYLGYADPRDRETASDPKGFFRTGDIGKRVNENGILVTGRKKDLIIRGGENLSAKEIEDALHQHEAIREAAVVSMPHVRLGETVCAYIIPASDARPTTKDLAVFLEDKGMARQKYPERVEYVDDLPRTTSGKVRKDRLRAMIAELVAQENPAAT
ncbi:AMP-binding protein [Tianweitania sediminis]|uniref:AMP-binding protein n=1 Tax=Tianweitania sediminis TaxID=1502156 RepID=A0A8J7UHY4_9HYPH|nr:AMP-binding protein [Tianweitania sediminis]MBP0438303.1 AMP-binding protein [Tianweitania sediminis]